nr:hypothetical protein [Tanacetum cinerariifolium]
MGVTRETGVSSPTDLPILSKGPFEGYSYLVCTTCGRRHPGECHRATGTCFKCGQTGHLQKDCKKNTTASTSGQAEKKPGASGRVFAITEDHATKTSGVSVMGVTRETGVSSPTDLSILVSSSPGVPLKATPTRSTLRVDADTQES